MRGIRRRNPKPSLRPLSPGEGKSPLPEERGRMTEPRHVRARASPNRRLRCARCAIAPPASRNGRALPLQRLPQTDFGRLCDVAPAMSHDAVTWRRARLEYASSLCGAALWHCGTPIAFRRRASLAGEVHIPGTPTIRNRFRRAPTPNRSMRYRGPMNPRQALLKTPPKAATRRGSPRVAISDRFQ